jgi:xanthine dehydrogenase accessory factor
MRALLEAALEAVSRGQTVALATIVRAEGSTPRAPWTKMLVFRDGTTRGTVGGGEMEQRVVEEALAALELGQPRLAHYTFAGGDEGEKCAGESDVFIDIVGPAKELLIVGAGHVGQAVAELGAFLEMDCVVFDARPECANAQRFPRARQIIVGEPGRELGRYAVTSQSYIVIVTPSPKQDAEALAAVIHSPAAYIGMIGSRGKIRRVAEMLAAQGVAPERLSQVHAPIGLGIGAETPQEIAVSILGQIIATLRSPKGVEPAGGALAILATARPPG